MVGGKLIQEPKRQRRRVIVGALVVVGLAILLFNPYTLILGTLFVASPIESWMNPACRTREYTSGSHARFTIGMSRSDAITQATPSRTSRVLVMITDPHRQGIYSQYWDAQTADQLSAVEMPNQDWAIPKGHTCIASLRDLNLTFRANRLTKIVDEIAIDAL
jgi:hypothetical protein